MRIAELAARRLIRPLGMRRLGLFVPCSFALLFWFVRTVSSPPQSPYALRITAGDLSNVGCVGITFMDCAPWGTAAVRAYSQHLRPSPRNACLRPLAPPYPHTYCLSSVPHSPLSLRSAGQRTAGVVPSAYRPKYCIGSRGAGRRAPLTWWWACTLGCKRL